MELPWNGLSTGDVGLPCDDQVGEAGMPYPFSSALHSTGSRSSASLLDHAQKKVIYIY